MMIKHHPTTNLLQSFSAGELPASLSAAISIHVDMCPVCQQQVGELTEQYAEQSFDQPAQMSQQQSFNETADIMALIDDITDDESIAEVGERYVAKEFQIKDKNYKMPRALQSMAIGSFSGIGKLNRARIELGEGEIHTSLMQIQPGGMIPEHTHKGFELTLLLDGEFSDDMGTYQAGDFIWLDGSHQHNPKTEDGCLCLTVVSDALHFTQGFGKLLNPFGSLLY